MRSFTSATRPPFSWMVRPPSPSTRASASTTIDFGGLVEAGLPAIVLIGVARGPEGCGVGVVGSEGAHELGARGPELRLPPRAQRGGVRGLGRAEAAEAAAL